MLEGAADAEPATHPDSPMSSVMKWMTQLHGEYAQGDDPVTAWFEGGDDVPLAGCVTRSSRTAGMRTR